MVQAKGAKGQLVLGYETTFGITPASPQGVRMPINKSGLTAKRTYTEAQTITGRRDPVPPSAGNIDVSGSFTVPVDARYFGHWLKACMGNPTTTGTGPYTHVFKIGDTQPSMMLENGFTDIATYALYNGCKTSKFALSLSPGGGELTANIDVMGAKETLGTTAFDAAPSTLTLTRFENYQAVIQEGGLAFAKCRKVDLNIDFGLDGDTYYLDGTNTRGDLVEGLVQITGTVETIFENKTLLDKAINSTESSLKITLTNGTNSLEILLPEIVYEQNTPGIDGPKGILVSLPFKAYYQNGADNTAVKVTLINDVASYATIA